MEDFMARYKVEQEVKAVSELYRDGNRVVLVFDCGDYGYAIGRDTS